MDITQYTTTEVKLAQKHYVFLERTETVLKESLAKARVIAQHAAVVGFPEPSVYRDDNDPLGIFDEEDDSEDEDYMDSIKSKKSKKSSSKGVKKLGQKRRKGKKL